MPPRCWYLWILVVEFWVWLFTGWKSELTHTSNECFFSSIHTQHGSARPNGDLEGQRNIGGKKVETVAKIKARKVKGATAADMATKKDNQVRAKSAGKSETITQPTEFVRGQRII